MHQLVYISSPDSQQIYVWILNDCKEKLELMQVVHTPGNAQPIIIHPTKYLIYVGIRPNFGIITYDINQNRLLHDVNITKISNSPTYLMINATGTFLYCASYNYSSINVITIDKTGIPNKIIQTIKNLPGCHSANIDKNKKLLWVPCLQEDSIRLFHIHQTKGILIPNNPDRIYINIKSGPRHMSFHNYSNYAYVINELNGTINVIKYTSQIEKPTVIQTISILPHHNVKKFWSSDIHITPDNNWLYCSDRYLHTISCFKICSKTKQLQFKYYQYTEIQPRSFAIDITGKFLIVAGQKSNYISLYCIDLNDGKLYNTSRYLSGKGPMWVHIHSSFNGI